MPQIPSGVLYFSVWKYLIFGLVLVGSTLFFREFSVFERHPITGIGIIMSVFLISLSWFEYGDARLFNHWNVDAERTNCDRLLKAFIYVSCCFLWPKFVNEND